jgi:nucleotide-binding universal stress UspA family protein
MAEDVARTTATGDRPTGVEQRRHLSGVVVVGLDGSAADEAVTDWAVAEAERAGRPVRLMHAVEPGYQLTPWDAVLGEMPSLSERLRAGGRAVVAAAAERVAGSHPSLTVDQCVEWGSPAAALVGLSQHASWLVLGAPQRHGLERVLLGSVALAATSHAHCPVAVVPAGRPVRVPRRVVVGVDGSTGSARAARLALATAARTGGTVTCVVAWSVEVIDGVVVTEPGSEHWAEVEARYARLVRDVIDPIAADHPDVPVDVVVRHGSASRTVVEVAAERDADLVVVGSRGRGGFAGLLLGSVSRGVVERAGTVVAVAH